MGFCFIASINIFFLVTRGCGAFVSSHEMEGRTINDSIFLPLNASVMEERFLGAERSGQLGGDAPKGDFYSTTCKVFLFYLRFRGDFLVSDASSSLTVNIKDTCSASVL